VITALSIIGYIVLVCGFFGLLAVGSALASHPLLIATQLGAAALMIWARITFGLRSFHPGANPTAGGLITTGPYRYIRHPIYASICLFAVAGLVNRFSIPALIFTSVMVAGAMVRIICEERLLAEKYPQYPSYARQTRRLIPGLF
jgi:protein-S-isoprenylcysteine O-methyltransferase Ste14